MELKNMSKEDLEILSYTDLSNLFLKETNKPMNTPTIFRSICDLLEYSDEDYVDKIGDFYTSLTLDKRFVFLETNEWDLRERHSVTLVLDDDELDEDIEEEILEEDETEEILEEDIDANIEELDDDVDDLDDLAVLEEDELED